MKTNDTKCPHHADRPQPRLCTDCARANRPTVLRVEDVDRGQTLQKRTELPRPESRR